MLENYTQLYEIVIIETPDTFWGEYEMMNAWTFVSLRYNPAKTISSCCFETSIQQYKLGKVIQDLKHDIKIRSDCSESTALVISTSSGGKCWLRRSGPSTRATAEQTDSLLTLFDLAGH